MTAPLALRLTVHGHHLDIADLLAEALPRGTHFAGLVLSRNDVLRLAIAHGLDALTELVDGWAPVPGEEAPRVAV